MQTDRYRNIHRKRRDRQVDEYINILREREREGERERVCVYVCMREFERDIYDYNERLT